MLALKYTRIVKMPTTIPFTPKVRILVLVGQNEQIDFIKKLRNSEKQQIFTFEKLEPVNT